MEKEVDVVGDIGVEAIVTKEAILVDRVLVFIGINNYCNKLCT